MYQYNLILVFQNYQFFIPFNHLDYIIEHIEKTFIIRCHRPQTTKNLPHPPYEPKELKKRSNQWFDHH